MSVTIAERKETVVDLEDLERKESVVGLEDLERKESVVGLEDLERKETVVGLEDLEGKETVVGLELEDEATDYLVDQDTGHDAPAQAHPSRLAEYFPPPEPADTADRSEEVSRPLRAGFHALPPEPADTADRPEGGPALAVFCFEDPDSFVGQYVSWAVGVVAARGIPAHVFGRRPFAEGAPGVHNHVVGDCGSYDLLSSIQEFTRRTCDAFGRAFPLGAADVTLLAHDWSAVPSALALKAMHSLDVLVEYHSLEWQRTNVTSETARQIAQIELSGLREARTILVHQSSTRDCAVSVLPECAGRIEDVRMPFPVHQFQNDLDPGVVKGRLQVGPIDPTIVYVGDLSEAYGADLLVKAMPGILKNHAQARLVIVGNGVDYWPMRVYSRYLLLDHAIRFAGDLQGTPLFELIKAADIVAVPSRKPTPWWPILAAWAAERPVVASHEAAPSLVEHDHDSVLIYPSESSVVWGIERLLYDEDLSRTIARRGHEKLLQRFGESVVAEQISGHMRVTSA
jgi:glycosyltransferase involved in cell wall biosynthesis